MPLSPHCHEAEDSTPLSRQGHHGYSAIDPVCDDLVALAAQCCHTPIALLFLTDDGRPFMRSNVEFAATAFPRMEAFCKQAMPQPDAVLTVEDTTADARFANNLLVTSDPWIRFYAGAPLISADGRVLGVLCVMDYTPRQLNPEQTDALARCARCLASQFASRQQDTQVSQAATTALLNALSDSALLVTPEGQTLAVNQIATQRFGVKAEDLLGRSIWELFPPTLAAARQAKGAEVARTGKPVTFQDEREGKFYENRIYPLTDTFGQIHQIAVFARDITKQKQAEAALQENERLLRLALGTLDIAVFRQDLNLRYTWILQPQLNYPSIQVVGKTEDELLPSTNATQIMAIKRRVLETGVGCREEVTVTSNGVTRYFELSLEPLQGDDGAVTGLLGATLDITARKEVEEQLRTSLQEKEVLLREIHHRVKNNLQIISSLLYLQAQKTANQGLRDMLQESRNRIISMSLIHEKLYQATDLARIAFVDYARELAQALFRSYGVSQANIALAIEGNDLTLDINHAVPCGLIINEVVSNSLKYAFPEGRRGVIHLALHLDQTQQYHFILSDNGVGMPHDFESRPRSSLGLILIERLTEQLQGTLERNSSAQGTTYHITFPRGV